jgi:osmotically inducible protein OsmC
LPSINFDGTTHQSKGTNMTATATKNAKVLFTAKTHTTSGPKGAGRSSDGFLDIKLPQPHPAAENLFGVAWSACYMGALELAAGKRKVALPADKAVDAEIYLNQADGAFFLSARLNVSLPGLGREIGEELIQAAHGICPYSKATHGNIEVETNLV